MKQFFKFFLASLLALVVAGILFVFVVFGFVKSASSGEKPIKNNSVLVIDLSQHFYESQTNGAFSFFGGSGASEAGLHQVLQRISAAKNDNRIKGIYLKAGADGSGIATSEQLRTALSEFKKSGKFVYAYGDFIPQNAYYVASVADSVFISPMGSVGLKGLASVIPFFKEALDRLEIQPEIFYCGKFKSATEPFRMDKMSEPNRHQIEGLQKTIWTTYLTAFAEHAGTDTATIDHLAQTGAVATATDALKNHLVDGIRYWDQIEALLRQRTDLKKNEKIRFVSIEDYTSKTSKKKEDSPKIALLIAQGDIVDHSNRGYFSQGHEIAADQLIQTIRKIKKDDDIKAVVFRVNSPGGSALASEKILRELDLLKAKKPLVVSMGDLAASGGYYISCQADSIFALPTTITGSIGVFGMMFNTQKFFKDKLGVTFDVQKNAPYADLGNPNRPMTAQEKVFIQNGVDSVYMRFKKRVAAGRHRSVTYIDSIAQGHVWSGVAAIQNGLVDALGGLNRAFKSAASLAKIKSYSVTVFPKPKNKFEAFFSSLKGQSPSAKIAAEKLLQQQLGSNYEWFKLFTRLKQQNGHIFMLMPVVPEIK